MQTVGRVAFCKPSVWRVVHRRPGAVLRLACATSSSVKSKVCRPTHKPYHSIPSSAVQKASGRADAGSNKRDATQTNVMQILIPCITTKV